MVDLMCRHRGARWRAAFFVITVATLGGCTGVFGSPEGAALSSGRADVGEEHGVVTVFDTEGNRQAVGILPIEESGEEASEHAPLILGVLNDGSEMQFPIGDTPILDAALLPRSSEVAFIDEEGRLCMTRGPTEPSCRSVGAVPQGMDVSEDGSVVFVADTGSSTNIWLLDPRSQSGPRRLTFGEGYRDRPLFDPAAAQVVFVGSSPSGLASLFVVSVGGGEPRQVTNMGLRLGLVGSVNRIPEQAIPPPVDRASMQWDVTGIRFEAEQNVWSVDPETGEAGSEVLQ